MDRRALLSAVPALVILALAVPALLIYYAQQVAGQPPQIFLPEGYNKIVNDWLARGLIIHKPGPPEEMSLQEDLLTEEQRDWYRQSFLKGDLQRFNGDQLQGLAPDRGVFLFDGKQWRINPYEHYFVPFDFAEDRWRGRLLFRSHGRGASLWSSRRTVFMEEPEPSQLPVLPPRYVHLDLSPSAAGQKVLTGPGVAVTYRDRTRNLAEIFYLGNDLVLNVRDERFLVWINGRRLPAGRQLVLQDGDVLVFGQRQSDIREIETQTFIYRKNQATTGVISSVLQINGRAQRVNRELLDFGPMLASRIELLARSGRSTTSFDVELTLDEGLHVLTNALLRREMRRIDRRRPAGIAVMDTLNGDLLALASYPSAEDAARISGSESVRRGLRRNHNFHLHPLGSAGKIFLATAVLEARPELAGLQAHCHPYAADHRFVLDMPIPQPYKGYEILPPSPCSDWFGFTQFLADSSNKYMVDLFTLALTSETPRAVRSGSGDPWLSWRLPTTGGWRYFGSGFNHDRYFSLHRMNVTDLERSAPVRTLTEIFGVDPFRVVEVKPDETEDTRNRYDLSLWKPLIDRLLAGEQSVAPLLSDEVTPESTNLRSSNIQNIRQEYVPFLLGGGLNQWTNVQLCEALARLATGRRVEARLVHRLVESNSTLSYEEPPPPAIPMGGQPLLSPETRRLVLEGMSEVLRSGTAQEVFGEPYLAALQDRYRAEGLTLRLYGKTGTLKPEQGAETSASIFLFVLALERDKEVIRGLTGAVYLGSDVGGKEAAGVARKVIDSVLLPFLNRMVRALPPEPAPAAASGT